MLPMKDPVISRFAEACSAIAPLDMRVDLAEGGVLAEGTVQMPFSLVGRDDACDVTLTDAEVNPRHAWLQVLGGRVFVVDLGSRTGIPTSSQPEPVPPPGQFSPVRRNWLGLAGRWNTC